jgi:hypothetical protein
MVRRRGVLVFLACAAVAGATGPLAGAAAWAAPTAPARAAGVFGTAIGVPGLAALNKGGNSQAVSVSCTSAGNCLTGGYYRDRLHHLQGFVATERGGRWGRAAEVPGLGALNKGGTAAVWSVSCTSAGNCGAAGNYRASGHMQDFVAVEKNGQWGRAAGVPGLGALNKRGTNEAAELVSCGSAGNCAVAGDYTDGDGHRQGYVASAKNGVWTPATEVPGLGALNEGRVANADAVSCASAGNCTAGGFYTDSSFAQQGFVAVEKNGTWSPAVAVPGLEALNNNTDQPTALVRSVSCATPGNCLVGGYYGGPYSTAFTASEKNGVWSKATSVPGLSAIVTGRWSYVEPVSCASPGNCAAGGDYERTPGGSSGVFVASQQNGRWNQAVHVPGLSALAKKEIANTLSVSCGSPGHCTVAGNYLDSHGHVQGFVS